MRLLHNSLATTIGWVSTCLLAGGAGSLFNESVLVLSMIWGSFGLAAAVGLDIAARSRERMRDEELKVIAARRFERDMRFENATHEVNADIRSAVDRILGQAPPAQQITTARRTHKRQPCNLSVELISYQGKVGPLGNKETSKRFARITNLSESGFELMLTETLPSRRMTMIIATPDGGRQTMFGEVMWYGPQEAGSIVAGGRFLDAAMLAGD